MQQTLPQVSKWRSRFDLLVGIVMLAAAVLLIWTSTRALAERPRPKPPGPTEVLIPAEPLPLKNSQLRGDPSAMVGLIVYSDFECPFCGRFARDVLPQIEKDFIAKGLVRLAFKHHPIEQIHSRALASSAAAECAGERGKFWEMHDLLFQEPKDLSEGMLLAHARALGLGADDFKACIIGPVVEGIRSETARDIAVGVRGTPTIYVGDILSDNTLHALRRFPGVPTAPQLVAVLQEVLSRPRGQSKGSITK